MKKLLLVVMTMAMLSLISWLIDNVFGRTLHPQHGSSVPAARTWDGHINVQHRGDPVAVMPW